VLVKPDEAGRVTVPVDLGPPNAQQQYTLGSQTSSVTRSLSFQALSSAADQRPAPVSGDAVPTAPVAVRGAALPATGPREQLPLLAVAVLVLSWLTRRRLLAMSASSC
jgi:hypothetical protein